MRNATPGRPLGTTVRHLDVSAIVSSLNSGQWYWVDVPDAPFPVAMQLAVSDDGRAVCVGVMGGSFIRFANQPATKRPQQVEVTATSLRQIPLGQMLDDLSRGMFAREVLGLPEIRRPTRLGPHGIPVERLAEVAALYRVALKEHPSAPVRWMAQELGGPKGKPVPEVTVRRWLQRCRDRGLLGASIPGKAGEQSKGSRGGRRP